MNQAKLTCIYCGEKKGVEDFNLEHVIPRFLGGAYVPECLKTRRVCCKCNSDLGLFVDGSFCKDHFVSNALSNIDWLHFKDGITKELQFKSMGTIDSSIIGELKPSECCEMWIGAFGEQIYLVRLNSEKFYWYDGGNPRDLKKYKSTAYVFLNPEYLNAAKISVQSVKSFFKGTKVRFVGNFTLSEKVINYGFSKPNELDLMRINSLINSSRDGKSNSFSPNINFDYRFMAKLCIGMGYCLFGSRFHRQKYTTTLRRVLWARDAAAAEALYGVSNMANKDSLFKKFTGVVGAIVLIVSISKAGVMLTLNINQQMVWSIKIAEFDILSQKEIEYYKEEMALVIIQNQMKSIVCNLLEILSNNNSELQELNTIMQQNELGAYRRLIRAV
jgi:hypothetical protein